MKKTRLSKFLVSLFFVGFMTLFSPAVLAQAEESIQLNQPLTITLQPNETNRNINIMVPKTQEYYLNIESSDLISVSCYSFESPLGLEALIAGNPKKSFTIAIDFLANTKSFINLTNNTNKVVTVTLNLRNDVDTSAILTPLTAHSGANTRYSHYAYDIDSYIIERTTSVIADIKIKANKPVTVLVITYDDKGTPIESYVWDHETSEMVVENILIKNRNVSVQMFLPESNTEYTINVIKK